LSNSHVPEGGTLIPLTFRSSVIAMEVCLLRLAGRRPVRRPIHPITKS
jgi:hypothetical protein